MFSLKNILFPRKKLNSTVITSRNHILRNYIIVPASGESFFKTGGDAGIVNFIFQEYN